MELTFPTIDDLRQIAASVEPRRGWDFTSIRATRDPVPWYYHEVVRHYLTPAASVLDTGTGGGERFLSLAPYFGYGVGIDVSDDMVQTARTNCGKDLARKVAFEVMSVDNLQFADESFDVVLNRHSTVNVAQIYRVLKPGGAFITQQVGPRNTAGICAVFGCSVGGKYHPRPDQDIETLVGAFMAFGGGIVARAEYDVPYTFIDLPSFLFWLQAIPMPEDFNLDRHSDHVLQIIASHRTSRGITTNEHRTLLIVRKT